MPFGPRISEIAQREASSARRRASRRVRGCRGGQACPGALAAAARPPGHAALVDARRSGALGPVVTVTRASRRRSPRSWPRVLPCASRDWNGSSAPTGAPTPPRPSSIRSTCRALRLRTLEAFVTRARLARSVWLLEDAGGPALLVSANWPTASCCRAGQPGALPVSPRGPGGACLSLPSPSLPTSPPLCPASPAPGGGLPPRPPRARGPSRRPPWAPRFVPPPAPPPPARRCCRGPPPASPPPPAPRPPGGPPPAAVL